MPFGAPRRRFTAAMHTMPLWDRSAAPRGFAALLLLAGCAHSAAPPNRPKAPEKPAPRAPAAPIDWLPADSFALLQLDVDQVRFLLPMPLLAAKLRPELHTLLERTHALIVAVRSDGPEAEVAGVFVGDY